MPDFRYDIGTRVRIVKPPNVITENNHTPEDSECWWWITEMDSYVGKKFEIYRHPSYEFNTCEEPYYCLISLDGAILGDGIGYAWHESCLQPIREDVTMSTSQTYEIYVSDDNGWAKNCPSFEDVFFGYNNAYINRNNDGHNIAGSILVSGQSAAIEKIRELDTTGDWRNRETGVVERPVYAYRVWQTYITDEDITMSAGRLLWEDIAVGDLVKIKRGDFDSYGVIIIKGPIRRPFPDLALWAVWADTPQDAIISARYLNASNKKPHSDGGQLMFHELFKDNAEIIKTGEDVTMQATVATPWKNFETAIENSDLAAVKHMVEVDGIDPHAFGDIALSLAAMYGDMDIVRYLVEKQGCDVNAEDGSPLRNAASAGWLDAVKYLTKRGTKRSALRGALDIAEYNHLEETSAYLKRIIESGLPEPDVTMSGQNFHWVYITDNAELSGDTEISRPDLDEICRHLQNEYFDKTEADTLMDTLIKDGRIELDNPYFLHVLEKCTCKTPWAHNVEGMPFSTEKEWPKSIKDVTMQAMSDKVAKIRDADGTLPAYSWPGAYPYFYNCADGSIYCPTCANMIGEDDFELIDYDINWEQEDLYCDVCADRIPSAYGKDDNKPGEPDITMASKPIEWLNPNKMKFVSKHKTFNKQAMYISSGNVVSDTQISSYIRPYSETTRGDGTIMPPGHLQNYDLNESLGKYLPEHIKDFIRKHAKTQSVIAYTFFHYTKNGNKKKDGWVVTTADKLLLKKWYGGYDAKTQSLIDEATKYITDTIADVTMSAPVSYKYKPGTWVRIVKPDNVNVNTPDRHACPGWVSDMDLFVGKQYKIRNEWYNVGLCLRPYYEISSGTYKWDEDWLEPATDDVTMSADNDLSKQVRLGTQKSGGGRWMSVDCRITIENGTLSIVGTMAGCGGQIYDRIVPSEMHFAKGWNTGKVVKFVDIWRKWHLNNMHAECVHQEALGWTYEDHPDAECPVCGYRLGSSWTKRELPADVVQFLRRLPDLEGRISGDDTDVTMATSNSRLPGIATAAAFAILVLASFTYLSRQKFI